MSVKIPVPPGELDTVISAVCMVYPDVSKAEILGQARPDRIAEPRHVAMTALDSRGWSQQSSAEAFNRKDHGTIWHARRRVLRQASYDKKFKARWDRVNEILERATVSKNDVRVVLQANIPGASLMNDAEKLEKVARMALVGSGQVKCLSIEWGEE